MAGYNGSACEGRNPRPCNGPKDGLWLASHCAGECDEATGFCWCPGKLRVRPMGESCQPRHMPLSAFAALGLPADVIQPSVHPNGSEALPELKGAAVAATRSGRYRALEALRKHLQSRPALRAALLREFWFGAAGEPSSTAAPLAPLVAVPFYSTDGVEVPHTASSPPAAPTPLEPAAQPAALEALVRAAGGDAPFGRAVKEGALFRKAAARRTWAAGSVLPLRRGGGGQPAWCEATAGTGPPAAKCDCAYPGMHGPLCEERHEAFCLNQCSGHGACAPQGGYCHCDGGYFGVDCSLTVEAGRVALHSEHAARHASGGRRPRIYIYDLPEHASLVLQYRAGAHMCSPRKFGPRNETVWNGGYAYTIDVVLHETLLRSPHRVADPEAADFFYIPTYLSCAILPVYDFVGPASYMQGFPMRPVTAMRMLSDAVERVQALGPYWRRSGGRDHLVLISHDEGGCFAPKQVAANAILLSHWGRTDAHPTSSSRYGPDNWEANWRSPTRAIDGRVWAFGEEGSRAMIGDHACYDPAKDLVVPVFTPPSRVSASVWLSGQPPNATRPTLAYFSGNLAQHEPLKYARGVRHRLVRAFQGTPGWMLVGTRGDRYAADLAASEFCIVPPGGDGWSSRVDDAVRHGCIPVIVMDGVELPFESLLDYGRFSLRVAEADVEKLDQTLRALPQARRLQMRLAMRSVWTRFTYASAILDYERYLPRRTADGRELPPPKEAEALRRKWRPRDPDAIDTILMALHARLGAQAGRPA